MLGLGKKADKPTDEEKLIAKVDAMMKLDDPEGAKKPKAAKAEDTPIVIALADDQKPPAAISKPKFQPTVAPPSTKTDVKPKLLTAGHKTVSTTEWVILILVLLIGLAVASAVLTGRLNVY